MKSRLPILAVLASASLTAAAAGCSSASILDGANDDAGDEMTDGDAGSHADAIGTRDATNDGESSVDGGDAGRNDGGDGGSSVDSGQPGDAGDSGDPSIVCYFAYALGPWTTSTSGAGSISASCSIAPDTGEIAGAIETDRSFYQDTIDTSISGSATTGVTAPWLASTFAPTQPGGDGPYDVGSAAIGGSSLCVPGLAAGTMNVHWTYRGHWADGGADAGEWTKDCDAVVTVHP